MITRIKDAVIILLISIALLTMLGCSEINRFVVDKNSQLTQVFHNVGKNAKKNKPKRITKRINLDKFSVSEREILEKFADHIPNTVLSYSGVSRGGNTTEDVHYKIAKKIYQRYSEFGVQITAETVNDMVNVIISESVANNINPLTISSIIDVESKFQPGAKSQFGATGMMQLMPATAKYAAEQLGLSSYNLSDYHDNIKLGTYYYVQECVSAWSHGNITQYHPKTGQLLSAYEMGLMTYNGNTKTARNMSNIEYMYSVEDDLKTFDN